MLTERIDYDHGTEIYVWQDGTERYRGYTVRCLNFDTDRRAGVIVAPSVKIDPPGSRPYDLDDVRRLAAEYAEVAAIAEALQTEKRAAFVAPPTEG